jgi:YcxB-like protein
VFGVVFGALWFAYILLAPRFFSRRQFKNNPMAQSPITLDASEQGLEFHNAHADSRVAWSAYVAWGEVKSVFIIMPQPRMYIAIPKRAFAGEQVDEFREMLRRNIKPN